MKVVKKFFSILLNLPISMKMRVVFLRRMGYKFGQGCLVGKYFFVSDRGIDKDNLTVGQRVNISSNVTIVTTSSPNTSELSKVFKLQYEPVIIEDDVWIGTGVIILPGVKIGRCSIIGAGTIIDKDIPAFSLVNRQGVEVKTMNKFLINAINQE